MADNDEQWLERALTREKESLEAGSGVMGELFKQYEQAAREIRVSVNDFLVRYEDEQGSAYDRVAKSLDAAEIQEWEDSVNNWAQRIDEEKDAAAKPLLQSRLKSVKCSDPPLTRLDLASRQMRIVLDDLSAKNVRQMWNTFESLYSEAYYKKIFDIEQRYGSLREFKKLDSEMNDVLSHPWSGVNFTDRMAENINMLHFQMRETIVHGLIHGKSSIEILKDLSDRTGASYKHLERLVQTESAYFHSEAIRMAYEAAGVKQYEYVAKLDRRTSDTCLTLDGKKFNVSDAKRGDNYPPMHPRCRSTTIEIADGIDESRMSGFPLSKDMTYEQWYKERVEGTGEGGKAPYMDFMPWEGKPVSGQRKMTLGRQRYASVQDWKALKKTMQASGIKVSTDSKGKILIDPLTGHPKAGGFNPYIGEIVLKPDATLHEMIHESIHAEQWLKLGKENYLKQSVLEREEYVFNELMKASRNLNEEEIFHAKKVIFKYRNGRSAFDWEIDF